MRTIVCALLLLISSFTLAATAHNCGIQIWVNASVPVNFFVKNKKGKFIGQYNPAPRAGQRHSRMIRSNSACLLKQHVFAQTFVHGKEVDYISVHKYYNVNRLAFMEFPNNAFKRD